MMLFPALLHVDCRHLMMSLCGASCRSGTLIVKTRNWCSRLLQSPASGECDITVAHSVAVLGLAGNTGAPTPPAVFDTLESLHVAPNPCKQVNFGWLADRLVGWLPVPLIACMSLGKCKQTDATLFP
jgi:hypothetical protein